jgi:hypothetical protein
MARNVITRSLLVCMVVCLLFSQASAVTVFEDADPHTSDAVKGLTLTRLIVEADRIPVVVGDAVTITATVRNTRPVGKTSTIRIASPQGMHFLICPDDGDDCTATAAAYEGALLESGQRLTGTAKVTFDRPGTYTLRCHVQTDQGSAETWSWPDAGFPFATVEVVSVPSEIPSGAPEEPVLPTGPIESEKSVLPAGGVDEPSDASPLSAEVTDLTPETQEVALEGDASSRTGASRLAALPVTWIAAVLLLLAVVGGGAYYAVLRRGGAESPEGEEAGSSEEAAGNEAEESGEEPISPPADEET